ncbi:hypothetical protein [Rhizobium leguminosarum]|uniref:hypothetical protein n=1 Tax=Rhizobium leguminosarum TaxID=384 RepID=UPI0014422D83|nr:hypothetical protein [Rhizobium leguminosarum]
MRHNPISVRRWAMRVLTAVFVGLNGPDRRIHGVPRTKVLDFIIAAGDVHRCVLDALMSARALGFSDKTKSLGSLSPVFRAATVNVFYLALCHEMSPFRPLTKGSRT